MLIVGIDPGLQCTGWGCIDAGTEMHFLAAGCVKTKSSDPLTRRLLGIYLELQAAFRLHRPQVVAMESIFIQKHTKSAILLGHARAAAILAAARQELVLAEYTPNQIKKSVVGVGHSGKQQITAMLRIIFPGAQIANQHVADALATALCHAQIGGWRRYAG